VCVLVRCFDIDSFLPTVTVVRHFPPHLPFNSLFFPKRAEGFVKSGGVFRSSFFTVKSFPCPYLRVCSLWSFLFGERRDQFLFWTLFESFLALTQFFRLFEGLPRDPPAKAGNPIVVARRLYPFVEVFFS